MLILDGHVHIYDCYELQTALNSASHNLNSKINHAATPSLGLCLTERPQCFFFKQIASGSLPMPNGWTVTPFVDSLTHRFSRTDEPECHIFCFAGRQINTLERIEVAALFYDEIIPDGQPAHTVIDTILSAGGYPVLNWAFGKWLFKRGRLIQNLIDTFGQKLILCDSAMRPKGWPAPRVFRMAERRQIPILCGTDPLPVPGEEQVIGSYHSVLTPFDAAQPSTSLKHLLTNDSVITPGGKRGSWPQVMLRQFQYYSKGC